MWKLLVPGVLVVMLAGCAASQTVDEPMRLTASAPPSPVEVPSDEIRSDLSADENRRVFDEIAYRVISSMPDPRVEDFTDALLVAGAEQTLLESSSNLTTENKTVDAIFWSLQLGENCLVGQFHPLETDPEQTYLSAILPATVNGCLIAEL